tara:strand:- start:305 stop:493 length:189 start_codon:yes stop_codon:yes gene_type:complete
MRKYEIVERKTVHHTFVIEADSLLEAAQIVSRQLNSIGKSPWEKVTTHVGQPEIQHIMEVTQ